MNGPAVLAWLHAQVATLTANLGDIAANRPEPAMQVLICTAVTIALAWMLFKIVRTVAK